MQLIGIESKPIPITRKGEDAEPKIVRPALSAARRWAAKVTEPARTEVEGHKVYMAIIAALIIVITGMMSYWVADTRQTAREAAEDARNLAKADHTAQQLLIDRWADVASDNRAELRTMRNTQTLQNAEVIRRLSLIEEALRARP
jgi:hypothetical protein